MPGLKKLSDWMLVGFYLLNLHVHKYFTNFSHGQKEYLRSAELLQLPHFIKMWWSLKNLEVSWQRWLWDSFLSTAGTSQVLSFLYLSPGFCSRRTLTYHKPCCAKDSDRARAEVSSFASSMFLLRWRMISQHTFTDLILLILLIHTHTNTISLQSNLFCYIL